MSGSKPELTPDAQLMEAFCRLSGEDLQRWLDVHPDVVEATSGLPVPCKDGACSPIDCPTSWACDRWDVRQASDSVPGVWFVGRVA